MFAKKTKLSILMSAGLLCLPVMTYASLSITNNTNHDSTSIINNVCSTIIGEKGITKKHETNEVTDQAIKFVCGFTPHNCVADLRMTPDCSGPSIATVTFDIDSGITSATLTNDGKDQGYVISHQPFSVVMDGGPA